MDKHDREWEIIPKDMKVSQCFLADGYVVHDVFPFLRARSGAILVETPDENESKHRVRCGGRSQVGMESVQLGQDTPCTNNFEVVTVELQIKHLTYGVGYLNPAIFQDRPRKGLLPTLERDKPGMAVGKCCEKTFPLFLPFPPERLL
jgi:hypothetical protein